MTRTATADTIEQDVMGIHAGDIHVVAVTAEERQDADGIYTSVSVELTPPLGETWNADDFYEVRRRIRERVVDVLGDDANHHITFSSRGDSGGLEATADALEGAVVQEKRVLT